MGALTAPPKEDEMRKMLWAGLLLVMAATSRAAEIQGVVADWNCTENMVRMGREKTLRQNRACSLMKDFKRAAYGLITDDKKFYKLDDPGNQRIIELLANTPDKDNLKVVVSGDIQGNSIKVSNITML
jgi:hypothetical protein